MPMVCGQGEASVLRAGGGCGAPKMKEEGSIRSPMMELTQVLRAAVMLQHDGS